MKSLLAPARGIGGHDRVDLAVQVLEDEWRRHGEVDLKRIWTEQKRDVAGDHDDPIMLLSELIKTDLRCRYARGQSPSITDYLESFSELRGADSRVLSLIYEQFCLGEERGDRIDVESFCDRYPQWKDSLLSQLQYHRLISQAAGVRPEPPAFPRPGDTFEEFQLLSMLGEGGTSRVFLARDLSLGGKHVVLKVSLDRGQEPKTQGALEHRHIVPVNSVVFGDRQLRGLSMPFRPGLPLDVVLRRIKPGDRPHGAMVLWRTLVEGTGIPKEPSAPEDSEAVGQAGDLRSARPHGDGWQGFPVGGTYSQGVAWIVMTVAQALDYAHRMRTFHRDVKPGNVLLTLEHGPQLLDFNLAESPHSVAQAEAAMHGGTLPYMAPEQIEAFLNPQLWGKVGAKADIYSLGLLLREMLTGQQPDLPAETMSPQRAMTLLLDRRPRLDIAVSRFNPAIPRALEAILAKCLAFSPDDRYPDARALAEDLHRFLNRRPLVHAVNPSRRERIANWAVRNRRTIAEAACVILIATLLVTPARRRFENYFVPIETSKALESVVKTMDDEELLGPGKPMDKVVASLDELNQTYPESWLPSLYLSFVRDVNNPCSQEAESLFREALKVPDARQQMVAWGRKHPRFASHLERFAKDRFEHAKSLVTLRPEAGPEERRPVWREHVSLAKDAASIAAELEPESWSIIRRLTLSEQVMGDYESAYGRMERVIASIDPEADRNLRDRHQTETKVLVSSEIQSLKDKTEAKVNEPNYIRCQIAIEWAKNLRGQGTPAGAEAALTLLRAAEGSAKSCLEFTERRKCRNCKEYRKVLDILLMVQLGLAELELDRGLLAEAEVHIKDLRNMNWEYEDLLRIDDTPITGVDRDRQERLQHAAARLRLKLVVGAVAGAAMIPAAEPTRTAMSPDENGSRPPR